MQRYSINKHQFLFFQKNKVGLKPFKPYTFGYITAHCVHHQKGWTGDGGWSSLQGDIHMVAARPGSEKGPWVGLGGPPLSLTAWTGLENTTHLVGVVTGWFLARKAACALSWCTTRLL